MSVIVFYVDESFDDHKFCLSAIGIRHRLWKECFELVKAHRIQLKDQYGLYLRKEIHAADLLKGRGEISSRVVTKWERSRIFLSCLKLVSSLPNIFVINICLEKAKCPDVQMVAWDRLTNRIQTYLRKNEEKELATRRKHISRLGGKVSDSDIEEISKRLFAYRARGIVIADQGREIEITSAMRRMRIHNPIPSKYGSWPEGKSTRNITTDHILEDPIFKISERSYFIQLADCVAHSLLKREVPPTERIKKYGIHEMFDVTVANACLRAASALDDLGIVRK